MFWRKLSSFAQIGARSLPKIVKRKDGFQVAAVLNRYPRFLSSESTTNGAGALRLWSDSGGEDVASNPFDDLGAWHDAEAKSFLHNVSVDSVGKSTFVGLREVNEDRFKLMELEPDLYYFAVFDGHGGSVAVDFVSEHLHECVKHYYSNDKNIESVLVKAFSKCNRDLEKYCLWLKEKGKIQQKWSVCDQRRAQLQTGVAEARKLYSRHFIQIAYCFFFPVMTVSGYNFLH